MQWLKFITYHKMRMLHCKAEVMSFCRKWGIYFAIVAVLFGAGTNDPVAIVASLAGVLLLPLIRAANNEWSLITAIFAYAVVGFLPVLLTRPLWWPKHWQLAECALPIASRQIKQSDSVLALWIMLPWQSLLALGLIAFKFKMPAAQQTVLWWSTFAWSASAILSFVFSIIAMRIIRLSTNTTNAKADGFLSKFVASVLPSKFNNNSVQDIGWVKALLLLPLIRGPAKRTGQVLIASFLALVICYVGFALSKFSIAWLLAAVALIVLMGTSLMRARIAEDLALLWSNTKHLPLCQSKLVQRRTLIVLVPAILAISSVLLFVFPLTDIRRMLLLAYVVVLFLGAWCESLSGKLTSQNRALCWLFTMVLLLAISSEVSTV